MLGNANILEVWAYTTSSLGPSPLQNCVLIPVAEILVRIYVTRALSRLFCINYYSDLVHAYVENVC